MDSNHIHPFSSSLNTKLNPAQNHANQQQMTNQSLHSTARATTNVFRPYTKDTLNIMANTPVHK